MFITALSLGITLALAWQDISSGRVRLELLLLWGVLSLVHVDGRLPADTLIMLLILGFLAWRKRLGWGDVFFGASACCWVPFAPYCMASGAIGCLVYRWLPNLDKGKPFIPTLLAALALLLFLGVSGSTRL